MGAGVMSRREEREAGEVGDVGLVEGTRGRGVALCRWCVFGRGAYRGGGKQQQQPNPVFA